MDTTRRQFIGMLGAAMAIGSTKAFAFDGDTEFRELEPDKMYFPIGIDGTVCIHTGDFWIEVYEGVFRKAKRSCMMREGKNELLLVLQGDEHERIEITSSWLYEFWRRNNGG